VLLAAYLTLDRRRYHVVVVVTRHQLRLLFHAGSVIAPASAFTPHGTCESAIKGSFRGREVSGKRLGKLRSIQEKEAILRRQDWRHRRARRRVRD
jgi:hypothetical protein